MKSLQKKKAKTPKAEKPEAKKPRREPYRAWKWEEDLTPLAMNSYADMVNEYLRRCCLLFRKAPNLAAMTSAVKFAHTAELAGIAVALRARACAKYGERFR